MDKRPPDAHLAVVGDFHLVNSDLGLLLDLLRANPRAVAVYRNWFTEWENAARGQIPAGQGAACADQWWGETKGPLLTVPWEVRPRIYVQGMNEPHPVKGRAGDLVAFELRRIAYLEAAGFKAAAFAFSPGVPEIEDSRGDDWPSLYPVLERLHQGGHMLCLHEYYNWRPDELVGLMTPAGRLAGWLVLRYRLVWDKHILPHGWTNIRIGIGETGRDNGGPGQGWQAAGFTAAQYVEHLKQLDEWWREDPEVVGGAVFLHGCWNPADWGTFDITGEAAQRMYDYVAQYNN